MRLLLFVVRRLFLLIPTLVGVTLITFVLSRAVPVDQLVETYLNLRSPIPREQQIAAARALLHLDDPIPVQYVYYLGLLLRGDWGFTNTELYHGTVTAALVLFFPPTVELAIAATFLATFLGITLRMVRAGMVDAMGQEYVKTAWSKGLPESVVIRKHIRRNALLPVTTVVGLLFAGLLGGVVLVEDVFVWNGIGRWATVAIISHDLAAILGTTLIFALFLVLANLVVDIIYAYLDPRITL